MNHEKIKQFSRRYCSYNGCSSDSITTNAGAISFFGFPKDTERCSKWITNSGREEFRYLTPRELSGKKICELHFHPCMFSNKFRTNLKKSAFPMNWTNSMPELIQIDDDDDDEDDNEHDNEHSLGNGIENVVVNGTDVQELSDDEGENGLNILNMMLLNSASNNNPTTRDSSNEVNENTAQEPHPVVVSNPNNSDPPVESQSVSAVISSTTVEENSRTSTVKTPSKPNPPPTDKTKFHNLPSQTTQGEFYYQQCPSVEETNHSYPEPPDGEMPLFVQQNSVVSMADEAANSEVSEPPFKKRKRNKEADLSAQMKDAMKYLKDITELLTTSEDEFELFGKSVALQLKKMSLCTALTVQARIQQVLSQYRINDIKKKAQRDSEDNNVEVNGIESDKSEEEPEEENLEKQTSPQLALDCISETSDNEVGNEEK